MSFLIIIWWDSELSYTIDYSWQSEKLKSWRWGLVNDSQRVAWTAVAILAMLLYNSMLLAAFDNNVVGDQCLFAVMLLFNLAFDNLSTCKGTCLSFHSTAFHYPYLMQGRGCSPSSFFYSSLKEINWQYFSFFLPPPPHSLSPVSRTPYQIGFRINQSLQFLAALAALYLHI